MLNQDSKPWPTHQRRIRPADDAQPQSHLLLGDFQRGLLARPHFALLGVEQGREGLAVLCGGGGGIELRTVCWGCRGGKGERGDVVGEGFGGEERRLRGDGGTWRKKIMGLVSCAESLMLVYSVYEYFNPLSPCGSQLLVRALICNMRGTHSNNMV